MTLKEYRVYAEEVTRTSKNVVVFAESRDEARRAVARGEGKVSDEEEVQEGGRRVFVYGVTEIDAVGSGAASPA